VFEVALGARFQGLWRHPDFAKLWLGQTISVFGSFISGFAIPILAVITLDASPLTVALLSAAGMAPGFVLGLVAGVWVDRLRRRPVLIATDTGRAAILITIPIAAALDSLTIVHLVLAAFATSTLSTFFDLAYRSYLPSLVRSDQLIEGNSKLQATASAAEVGGFAIAGGLVQLLTAPVAILIDVVSFLVSALCLGRIGATESADVGSAETEVGGTIGEIRSGLTFIRRDATLATLALAAGTWELCRGMVGAVIFVFVARDLDLAPALIGVIFGVGGVSALLGAVLAEPAMRRWGIGRTLILAFAAGAASILFLPLAAGPIVFVVIFLVAQQLAGDGFATIHEIGRVSIIQGITPDRLQGRVNGAIRSLEWGTALLGLLLGGLIAEVIGLRPTLVIAGIGAFAAPAILVRSDIARLRDLPASGAPGGEGLPVAPPLID
jgi:MFS family permease